MTAPNHALTGALIGLTISNPAVALPLAFLSHFVCDLIPHYDQAEQDDVKRIGSRQFFYEFIVLGVGLCLLIVAALAFARPEHWLQAAICAFLATSPDLFWFPRFFRARKGQDRPTRNPFLRFHSVIQWKTGPQFLWLETVWFVAFGALLFARL